MADFGTPLPQTDFSLDPPPDAQVPRCGGRLPACSTRATIGERELFFVYDAANARIIGFPARRRCLRGPVDGAARGRPAQVCSTSVVGHSTWPRWPTARRSRTSPTPDPGGARRARVAGARIGAMGELPYGRVRLIEMVVESVRVHMLSSQHVVILKDNERDRYLPIWIGPAEANAIAMRLQGLVGRRPADARPARQRGRHPATPRSAASWSPTSTRAPSTRASTSRRPMAARRRSTRAPATRSPPRPHRLDHLRRRAGPRRGRRRARSARPGG